jgi:hypothetical protein
MRNSYKILVGKPEAKRPYGRPRYRWKNNIIIMALKNIGGEYVDQINLDHDTMQQ